MAATSESMRQKDTTTEAVIERLENHDIWDWFILKKNKNKKTSIYKNSAYIYAWGLKLLLILS